MAEELLQRVQAAGRATDADDGNVRVGATCCVSAASGMTAVFRLPGGVSLVTFTISYYDGDPAPTRYSLPKKCRNDLRGY